ncbi:cysteine-tryptophan domain-containing zinc finger protein 3 isoform X1 [Raphanus sativus]|uniref:Cysteine-tryptophan domain-containing zinc finger protein 3 isoform X1 n=3 Tax=Raphanus sativus TaxID=3726 RepID=A0A6J0P8J8_RAPSA|nr:cysteine-tryptophan domain-containing zinc finger protein 3 isoform X1 [Raphanus sativus]
MISVSSSDARNEIGLGFGGIEEVDMEMEEDEEESTHSYVSCVDPDVALSYIDEKLENVLGHFQKDFEGGVSAENLGSKYGGYGSFLSMYQRSPVCKSPPQVQNQVVGQSKCSASSAASGSTSKPPPPPPPASDVLAKMKNLVKSSSDSKQKPVTKTSPSPSSSSAAPPSNHKTFKLRIKVGSSDLSLKNVSTYDSKQGLNMPPSEVEGRLLNGVHDSPTKILMAMVSFPLHKDQLLSPLSDDLIQLGKKGNITKDAQKCVKKEKLKYVPPSNRLDGSHIGFDTEKEADKESCEELVSKTMKLPLLSCLSPPSSIHRAKEIDKISDSYVEGTLRGMNNTDLDATSMGSKPELKDDVEGTESVNTRKDVEEGEAVKPSGIEHVDYSSVVTVGKSETRSEEQSLKSKLPKAQKSQSKNSLKGKDAAVNITNTNVPDKLQEDIGGSKEQEQSVLVPKAKKEKLSEESALKESFNSVRNVEEAWKCEPDSKHPIKSSDLYKDGHNSKQSVKSEVKNKHFVEGGMKNVGMEPERELCKKPKTGKSRFSAVDQPGSNKAMKDIGKASPHEDRKRKRKENKESGDCMREATVMESSGEKVRKQKRLKGSSCDVKELPESCDRDRVVTQGNDRDSVQEAKGSLADSLAPSALDPRELKSERISEQDEPNDTAGDTRKRCREGEGYITMDKPGTTKKAAENFRDSKEGYCTESEPQEKNREGRSSAALKENHRGTANEVQDLGAAVEVKTKESRNKRRPARKVSMESNKEDSREHQDPINKLNTNSTDQVEVLNHGREISSAKTKVMRNDNHDVGSRNQKQNGSAHNDHVGSSPLKKEITSQAASNSIKEATDLKHIADRLKNAGNNHESIGFYFQAALKFLHGASLLESSGTETATHKSIATSKHIYGSTAKLCKFCAHEYEKDKDMGAAALAYKCMEVAYLRITYSSHGNINRYKSELEASLQVIPSGESPSFASDGENPNKTLAAEKVALSTPVRSSPKVTGNLVLSSGNNSSLSQLLTFSQNVSLAMDASRKAQTAFAVAKGKSSDTRYSSNGVTSIKRALDFSFQDMEKLVHAVRLAMESINR